MKLLKESYKYFALPFILFYFSITALSQELNCTVTVNSGKVRTTDRSVFDDMENSFEQFLNQQKWTTEVFKPHERINCNINIVIEEMPSIGQFLASVQIQSARPVFNSNYESTLFNFADRDWQFDYVESQPLNFSDNNFNTNLTSLLAYYAYVIIGFDYDSFSEMGGTPYFQKALNVVNNAQQSNRAGWKSLESNRNRYWLLENITNRRMDVIRKGYYTYHRLALDTFKDNPDEARRKLIPLLREILRLSKQNPGAILIITFLDAKANELINIYSDGDIQVRREAYNILSEINPARRDQYAQIIK
ncbi:MAG: DUF4835 family protein [Cyclobacteriaceae bacterium]|nr:DUF4835 family protein [Cyclobacteriaceae bacterium]